MQGPRGLRPEGRMVMEGTIAGALSSAFARRAEADDKGTLLSQIAEIKLRMDTASSHFDSESDPDLIEASIYELKSLSARYRYLLREARKQGITNSMDHILEHAQRV